MGDYEKYLEAERLYKSLCNNHPDVIREMKALIDQYAKSRDEVYGNKAGSSIIRKHSVFKNLCGVKAAQVFGILLNAHLDPKDWIQGTVDVGGKKVKVYQRT